MPEGEACERSLKGRSPAQSRQKIAAGPRRSQGTQNARMVDEPAQETQNEMDAQKVSLEDAEALCPRSQDVTQRSNVLTGTAMGARVGLQQWRSESYAVKANVVRQVQERLWCRCDLDGFAAAGNQRFPAYWGQGSPLGQDAFQEDWNFKKCQKTLWMNPRTVLTMRCW